MSIVHVEFDWDDRFGPCIDCGKPAAYEMPEMFGKPDRSGPEVRLCSVCAAHNAYLGNGRLIWLFEEPEDMQEPWRSELIAAQGDAFA